jgi:hypothetical protein
LLTDAEFSFENLLDESTFKTLVLNYSGKADRSNFASHPERLENIIKAFGKVSAVSTNLKDIKLSGCGLDKSMVEMLLNELLPNCKLSLHSK